MTPCELKDNMIVQLVSFPISRLTLKEREYRIDTISRILNETDADFVMFSEHILKSIVGAMGSGTITPAG